MNGPWIVWLTPSGAAPLMEAARLEAEPESRVEELRYISMFGLWAAMNSPCSWSRLKGTRTNGTGTLMLLPGCRSCRRRSIFLIRLGLFSCPGLCLVWLFGRITISVPSTALQDKGRIGYKFCKLAAAIRTYAKRVVRDLLKRLNMPGAHGACVFVYGHLSLLVCSLHLKLSLNYIVIGILRSSCPTGALLLM